jgi:acyl carrier protein
VADATRVVEVVRAEIAEMLGIDPREVTLESPIIELGAQSFDFVELVVRLEKAFETSLPKELTIPDMHTVGRFVEAVIASKHA